MSKVVIVVSASIFNTSTVLPSCHHPAPRSEGEQQGAKVINTGGLSYEDEAGDKETYPGT